MIDIGANLTNESFKDDLESVLERAQEAKVSSIIVTGSNVSSSQQALELALQYPQYLYATAGMHPHEADSFNDATINEFRHLLSNPAVIAIGETGLDFNRNFSTQENQIRAFEAHLELAYQIDKPLFLHERDAFDALHGIMRQHPKLCERAVVHCFTGNQNALKHYLDLGLYIGITGWLCDKKRGATLREIMQYAPLERLMIETDAPYLIPHKERVQNTLKHKRRNEPWTLRHIAKLLAELKDVEEAELIEAVTDNTRRFFSL